MLYIRAYSLDESLSSSLSSLFSFPFTPSRLFATSKGKKVEYSRSFDKQTHSTPKKGPHFVGYAEGLSKYTKIEPGKKRDRKGNENVCCLRRTTESRKLIPFEVLLPRKGDLRSDF